MCSGAGFWRFGPLASLLGQQDYLADSAALVTAWSGAGWKLELTDTMLWPQRNRSPGRNNGAWWCATCAAAGVYTMQVCPRDGFDTSPVTANRYPCALAT